MLISLPQREVEVEIAGDGRTQLRLKGESVFQPRTAFRPFDPVGTGRATSRKSSIARRK